jgi:uncharacterized protein YgfB (UPF0149 family)
MGTMLGCCGPLSGARLIILNDQTVPVELPDYGAFAAALERCGAAYSPAEAQGFALGLHLAHVERPDISWQTEMYADFDPADVLAGECRNLLEGLFQQVFGDVDNPDDGLVLLLPEDLVVDSGRLAAVRDWCAGFLYGVGQAGEAWTQRRSPQAAELLRDIAEIARLEVEDTDDSEENQSALMEIEEYLRVGVMLLRDESRGEVRAYEAD